MARRLVGSKDSIELFFLGDEPAKL